MQAKIIKTPENEEYYFEEGCFILELSNSAQDPKLSIARARVKAGMSTRLHRLSDIIERYVILSGQGSVEQHASARLRGRPVLPGKWCFYGGDRLARRLFGLCQGVEHGGQ